MKEITVEQLLNEQREALKLELVAGEKGLKKTITTSDINRPGLALAGYFDYFAYQRIQVFGRTELSFFATLEENRLRKVLETMFSYDLRCLIVTLQQEIPHPLREQAERKAVPLLRTSLATTKLVSSLAHYLEDKFAPETSIHGVLMDVYGVGILILGKSGVGKSELALDLVERGHRLVADDVVYIKRKEDGSLVGQGSGLIKHHMDVRGLGIIDVPKLFGVGAVRNRKPLGLVICLEDWDQNKDYERLGWEQETYTILDISLPKLTIPVRPGRNLSIIIEAAALNDRLKRMGHDTVQELEKRLLEAMGTGKQKPEEKPAPEKLWEVMVKNPPDS